MCAIALSHGSRAIFGISSLSPQPFLVFPALHSTDYDGETHKLIEEQSKQRRISILTRDTTRTTQALEVAHGIPAMFQ